MLTAQSNKFNYYYPSNYGVKATTVERLDVNEDAQKKIESGNLVHIPFISKQFFTEEKEIPKVEFNDLEADPRHKYERYDLLFNTYFQFLQQLIAEKKFDEKDLRKYLLVKLLVTKAIHFNPYFAQIGKALSIVQEKSDADSIREKAYKNEKTIGFNSENKYYSDQDQKQLQEALLATKGLTKLIESYYKYTNDDLQKVELLHQVYDKNFRPVGGSNRKNFYYYNLEAIRVTNLAIDETIAQQRSIHNKYDIEFSYYTNEQNQATKEATSVYSLIIDVSLDKLKQEAKLTDDILSAAQKVAKVLVESHKLYIQSKKGVANMTGEFFKRYYNLYQNPIQGDHVYISPEIQSLAYIYLNAKLTNKNINKIDE
ncbi:hypothetical protein ABPG72_016660 [Tetrahymena utriculariae]